MCRRNKGSGLVCLCLPVCSFPLGNDNPRAKTGERTDPGFVQVDAGRCVLVSTQVLSERQAPLGLGSHLISSLRDRRHHGGEVLELFH